MSKTPTQDIITIIHSVLNRLDAIAASHPPDWKLPLSYYQSQWCKRIGATAIATDEAGPSVVVWCGHTYTRRSGSSPKYGAAIWFSRATGTGEDGTEYARLITFKDTAPAEPLPSYIIKELKK